MFFPFHAEDAPADVAFDLLGYEASVQEAMSSPWAKSFAMCSSAGSDSAGNFDGGKRGEMVKQ